MDRVWEAQSQHHSMLANVTSAVQKPQSQDHCSTGVPNTNKYGGYFDMSRIFHCSVTLWCELSQSNTKFTQDIKMS